MSIKLERKKEYVDDKLDDDRFVITKETWPGTIKVFSIEAREMKELKRLINERTDL